MAELPEVLVGSVESPQATCIFGHHFQAQKFLDLKPVSQRRQFSLIAILQKEIDALQDLLRHSIDGGN